MLKWAILIIGLYYFLRDSQVGREVSDYLPVDAQDFLDMAGQYLPDVAAVAGVSEKISVADLSVAIENIRAAYPYTSIVPTTLALGLIRKESGFNAGAAAITSSARGLMQVLRGTAYGVIRQFGLNIPETSDAVIQPINNLTIGMHYLASLMRKYGGDKYAALEAYRMGPGAFDKGARSPEGYAQKVLMFAQNFETAGYA